MTKKPPHRRGITFEVGAPLEARDSLKNWYAATIEKIDLEDEKVLIHYRQWSHRYDEWFDWSSPYLRPVERIQLRRQGLQDNSTAPGFHINQKVLASWSDCRYYPAKILSRNKDDSYTVKFFDGVVKSVKGIKIKPFRKEGSNDKTRSVGRKRGPGGKVWKPKENGTGRADGGRHGDHESETEEEEEEEEEEVAGAQHGPDELWEDAGGAAVQKVNGDAGHEEGLPEPGEGLPEPGEGPPGEAAKADEVENNVEDAPEEDRREMEQERVGALPNGSHESSGDKQEKDETSGDSPGSTRRTRGKPAEGRDAERPNVPELRKRRTSACQTPPSKRSRTNSSTDRNGRSQIRAARADSAPGSLDDQDGHNQPDHPADPKPTEHTGPMSDLATLLQRQVHLPTTNKFSREPLYRVIKNQPPPILSIELDHNPFKCQVPGCPKSFRKASLLHYHMKYYHSESDLSPPHGLQTHGPDHQETPRRRRAASASIETPSPLSDSKSGHTPSPPTANGVRRQRSSSHCERSKENQHANRSLHDDRDWVAMETGGGAEREKRKEKRPRELFCIKPKKKKKKKKKSKSDSHSSEKSNGFSPSPCNLTLSLKLPLSPKHSYAAHDPEQEPDDGEDSGSDWSTDSPLWSEEESEVGLDVTTPLCEQGAEMVAHDSEIVRCVCEVQEENDFMIQCDECLCWQHGTCMGLYEDSIPDTYTCYVCRDPPAQRRSQRYWYDKDWLNSGHMYGLSFLEENYSQQNSRKMATTHQLLGDVHRVFEVLNGLQLKMSILQTQAHPDLKLWRQSWRPAESIRRKGGGESGSGTTTPTLPPCSPQEEGLGDGGKVAPPSPPTIPSPASYISSEHCYQKPRTYYPALERRLVVETRSGSELEHSLRSSEDLLELAEHRYGACLEAERCKPERREIEYRLKVKEEEPDPLTCDPKPEPDPDPDLLVRQQWQLNLLEHIEAVQDEVSHRMDLIERELDVLESWLDYTGELEPPDPLARLPQLKHRIRQLLTDLGTVQQIALCSSTT